MNTTIDDVARQMTEEAPPSDGAEFRRRVLARIASNEAPRASWRAAFVLSPMALAAAIVIAVFIAHKPSPVAPGVSPPAPTVATGPTNMAAPGPALQITSGRPQPVRSPQPLGPGVSRPAPQLDPIEVDSIAVAPLAISTLSPDPIQIERLDTIAPMTVVPLDIPDVQRRFE